MPRAGLVLFTFLLGCTSVDRASMDHLFRPYDGQVPGASVLVVRDGVTVYKRSFGLADLERGTPAQPSTAYRLASVSKQFTAMAILTLADRGALSLDAPLTSFFPEFPSYASSITVEHLLTHTSGLVDYEDVIPPGTTVPLKDVDVLQLLSKQKATDFTPGSRYRYSNSGYALLALIAEKVSGKTFAGYLRDEIFLPAGMRNTVAYESGLSEVANRAYGHSRSGDTWTRTDQSLTSAVLGDGGVYSSIDDLERWTATLDQRPLAVEAVQPRVATGADAHYGYGWFIGQRRGRSVVWHTGETIGFRNAFLRVPQQKLTVIVLTNRNEGQPIELALDIAELSGAPVSSPALD